jgi:hypothetical protein
VGWENRKRAQRSARPRAQFQVESLEDRCLLSHSGGSLRSLLAAQLADGVRAAPAARAEVAGRTATRAAAAPRGAPAPLLPDLIVWANSDFGYLHGWTIDTEEPAEPGRRLLRFATAVPNIGDGPLELRGGATNPDGGQVVFQRIYNDAERFTDREAGTFTFHEEHGHIHFDDYAQYNLRAVTEDDGVGDVIATGGKVSFCLLDVAPYDRRLPGHPRREQYNSCGSTQGISVGWADVYDSALPDQWIDVTDVPDGTYWLEAVVDPSNLIVESDETNNVTRIQITLGPPPADDFADAFADATPIALAQRGRTVQTGTVGLPRDVDTFRVVTPRKGRLTITQSSIGGLDSFLIVYDSNQTEIARDDDSGGNLNSRVRIQTVRGQTIYVQAGGYQTDTGPYQLTFTYGRGWHIPQLRAAARVGLKSLTHPLHP